MGPIAVGAVVAGVHLLVTFGVLLVGLAPTFRRIYAGAKRTRYDRVMQRAMRVLVFPMHPLTERWPGWIRRGFPGEHLLFVGNSAAWGITAGLLTLMI